MNREIVPENNSALELLFPSPGDAGILNHELEHARRKSDCSSSSKTDGHADAEDREGRFVSFEACAASYARHAHRLGLIPHWAKAIEEELGSEKEIFQSAIEPLRKLEATACHQLLQALLVSKN
jgi:hypothetical protein